MARAATWAIRATFSDGREAFVRHGGAIGRGPIASFPSKARAEEQAAFWREGLGQDVTLMVIPRSHGRLPTPA